MKHAAVLLFTVLFFAGVAEALPIRPAPDFTWKDAYGKLQTLKSLEGKPVVIVISSNVKDWRFRLQMWEINGIYERLAAMGAVFVMAFTDQPGRVPSNIPFIVASDGPRVGYLYNITKGNGIAIISKDGNLDYVTNRILLGRRILDVIQNTQVTQEQMRRD